MLDYSFHPPSPLARLARAAVQQCYQGHPLTMLHIRDQKEQSTGALTSRSKAHDSGAKDESSPGQRMVALPEALNQVFLMWTDHVLQDGMVKQASALACSVGTGLG